MWNLQPAQFFTESAICLCVFPRCSQFFSPMTQEAVLQNLWPMLDQHCRGCITTDSLLFLEKDGIHGGLKPQLVYTRRYTKGKVKAKKQLLWPKKQMFYYVLLVM